MGENRVVNPRLIILSVTAIAPDSIAILSLIGHRFGMLQGSISPAPAIWRHADLVSEYWRWHTCYI